MRKQAVIGVLVYLCSSLASAAVPQRLSVLPDGDRLLYSRIVDAYRRNQMADVKRQTELLARNYPSSVHLDNAYYLSGMLHFQNAMYGEAIREFGVVRFKFPKSNKRPGAMFAMAVTYDRLGLKPEARRVFEAVIKEYPGSQESQRAWMHLQMGKPGQGKKQ